MIYIYSMRDKLPENVEIINTTSHSTNWSRGLSPFYLGPCELYNGYSAKNVENAWQYSKVYKCHVDENGDPTDAYFKWAIDGWNKNYAVRYPMGRNAKPEYSLWNGEKLDYISARIKIYLPVYGRAVIKSKAFAILREKYKTSENIYLTDFDGYNYIEEGLTLKQVIKNPRMKCGHSFVLAYLLEKGA